MLGRLRRTARFIATTTYGHRDSAMAAIAKVKAHPQRGQREPPRRTPYRACDPRLLAWVHVAGAVNFLDGWRRYAEPNMSSRDQDDYFEQSGEIARMLGADPVPESRAAADQLIGDFRHELRADARSREFRSLVLEARSSSLAEAGIQKLLMSAAVDLMPAWARRMHGLNTFLLSAPPIRAATFGLASTIRWAFAGENYRAPH